LRRGGLNKPAADLFQPAAEIPARPAPLLLRGGGAGKISQRLLLKLAVIPT
jgi:hypothetical protein